jgi:hypothetical protein
LRVAALVVTSAVAVAVQVAIAQMFLVQHLVEVLLPRRR